MDSELVVAGFAFLTLGIVVAVVGIVVVYSDSK